MRRRCDVNRSVWFWASIVCLRFLAERGSKRARVQSRSSEREPKGNLDGFLGRLHAFPQNEGQQVPGAGWDLNATALRVNTEKTV
jgi:hypothetical protein